MPTTDQILSPSFVEESGTHPRVSFGRYVLLEELGAGGMGRVYAAWDRQLGRRVALKVLHQGQEPHRLQREGQALARLKHENVVTIYDVGEDQGESFIAMELLEGQSLRRWLREGPRPAGETLRVLCAAGRGLAAAHRAGLVHRDFKPDNVIVGDDGSVRVVDFGLVRLGDEVAPAPQLPPAEVEEPDTATATRSGLVLGTPRYMAPEQLAALPPDARADQYAFAVTALEALTGEHPVIHDHPFAAPRGKLRARARAVLARGMAGAADARWPSMDALLAELTRSRSTRRLALGALALGLLSAGAVGWQRSGAPARACEAAAAQLDLGWGAGERAALKASLLAAGGPAEAVTGATEELDRHAGLMRRMAGEACGAARVQGAQSEQIYGLRRACLERKARALQVLVGELAHADHALAGRAADAVRSLAPVSECGDVEALSSPSSVPADPALRPAVRVLERELAELQALEAAGTTRPLLIRSLALVPLARLVGFRPFVSEALLQLDAARGYTDDRVDTAAMLEEALLLAEATGDDLRFVRAAIKLVVNRAQAAKLAEGRRWSRLAAAGLERLGVARGSLRWRVALELADARLALIAGDLVAAVEHARRALAQIALLGERPARTSYRAIWSLALAELSLGRLAEAEADLVRGLGLAAGLALPSADRANLWALLAAASLREGRFAEARWRAQHGLDLLVATGDGDTLLASSLMQRRSMAEARLGRHDEALAGYRRARELGLAHGSIEPLTVVYEEAAFQERRYAWSAARELLLAAATLAVSDDERRRSLSALARVESELGETAAARTHADAALIVAARLDPSSPEAAHAFQSAGMAYAGDPPAGLRLLGRARPGFEGRYGARSPEVAELVGRIGVVALAGGDAAGARALLEEAYAMAPEGLLPASRLALARLDGHGARAARLLAEARAGFAARHDAAGEDAAARLAATLAP